MVMLNNERLAVFIASKGEAVFHNADDGNYAVITSGGGAPQYVGPFGSSREAFAWREKHDPNGSVIPLTSPVALSV